MPAFSAIGLVVAEALVGGGFATVAAAATAGAWGFVAVASVVAMGTAMVASRLINGGGGGGGTMQDPGVRIQMPPATDNKVPVIYGSANTKGIGTDARISDDNQQMTYVLVLSEKTQSGAFTIGDVFWNDQLLTFDSSPNGHKVVSSRDQNGLGDTSTNFAGLVEMRVFAGSATTSTSQIFPTTDKVTAISYIGESTSTYMMSDLVYAVVKLTYNSEKSVTGLPQLTFQVNNSLYNPGMVLYDYLTSVRYGAGIDSTQIDTDSMTNLSLTTSLRSISNEVPANQYNSDGSTSTQSRYIINGVLSAGDTVKNNLEKITQACASWLTYDFTQGKWTVRPNRALSVSELTDCVVYDDDKILGEISVNATNLEDLYNSIEVEFPSREMRDQSDYYRAEIAASERNDMEPDNTLSLRYDLINNAIHAQRLGSIELLQSRADRTIQFKTDYSGLQTKASDVIKVTNEVYGFTEKLFRVTRVREVEDDIGGLYAEITGLEYDATVYTDSSITDYQPNTATGIPSFGGPVSLPAPSAPTLSLSNPTANIPNFTISTTIATGSSTSDLVEWWYSSSAGGTYTYLTNEHGSFASGTTVTDIITGLGAGTWYFKARALNGALASPYSSASASFTWNPQPGGVNNGSISTATFSSQVQVVNTTSNSLLIPLVATTSGYQPVYADSELSYDAAANQITSPGGIRFTSTGSVIEANWGQQVAANDRSVIRSITANTATGVYVAPTGSGDGCSINMMTTSSLWQSARFSIGTTANSSFINLTRNNTNAPFQNLAILTGGITRMTVSSSSGVVSISTTTDSNSIATGGLVLSGGLGVAKAITVGGAVTLNTTTNATTTQTGSLIVGGGVGIGRDVYIGGEISVVGSAWTAYTPTWSTSGTAPAINNGTLSGRYKQVGKTVFFSIRFTAGSTVAGYYLVNYQVAWTKASAYANQQNIQIQRNGSTVALSQNPVYISTSTSNFTQSTFGIVQLNGSTDYVTGTVYTDGTGQSLIASSDGAWTKITLTKLQ